MKTIASWLLSLLIIGLASTFSGCVALESGMAEGGLMEEGAALSAGSSAIDAYAAEDALMSASDREILAMEERNIIGGQITAETALTELENVRLVDLGEDKPPQLQFVNSNEPFAEVLDKRTIRFLKDNQEITLHHDVYAIKGDYVVARTSFVDNSSHAYRVLSNRNMRLVLKLGEEQGYYKVLVDRNEVCWLTPELLIPVIIIGSNYNKEETIVTKYPNGRVKEKYQRLNGKVNGCYSTYHDNGYLWTAGTYSNGRLTGFSCSYNRLGRLVDKGSFKNGYGTVNIYNENGDLVQIQTYSDGTLVKVHNIPPPTAVAEIDPKTPITNNGYQPPSNYSPAINDHKTYYTHFNYRPAVFRQAYDNTSKPIAFSGNVEFHGRVVGGLVTIKENSDFVIGRDAIVRSNLILERNSTLQVDGRMEGNIYDYGGHIIGRNFIHGRVIPQR